MGSNSLYIKFYKWVLNPAFLLLIFICACKKDPALTTNGSPLKINPSVLNESTKAAVNNSNITSCSIGVQVTNAAGTAFYENKSTYNNLLLRYSSSWFFDNGAGDVFRVILFAGNAALYAYYPYNSSPTSITGIGASAYISMNVPSTNTIGGLIDYIWAAQTTTTPSGGNPINANNPVVTLNLQHALSQIAFVIYKEGYAGSGVIESIQLVDNSTSAGFRINKSGTNDLRMKLSDGSVSGGEFTSAITVNGINSTITLTSDPGTNPSTLSSLVNGYLFVVPFTITDMTKLQSIIRIDGDDYYISLPGSGSFNFTAGNKYIFKGKLLPRGMLTIESVTVNNWNEGGEIVIDSN